MFPHEKALSDNGIAVTDLPEKTQKKIAKFAAETDEDKRDSLDESIFGDVEDFIDAKNKAEKEAAKKANHAKAKAEAAEKKKIDVSNAPTATGSTEQTPPPAPKPRTLYDKIYGR